jgi:hypothetical protein
MQKVKEQKTPFFFKGNQRHMNYNNCKSFIYLFIFADEIGKGLRGLSAECWGKWQETGGNINWYNFFWKAIFKNMF